MATKERNRLLEDVAFQNMRTLIAALKPLMALNLDEMGFGDEEAMDSWETTFHTGWMVKMQVNRLFAEANRALRNDGLPPDAAREAAERLWQRPTAALTKRHPVASSYLHSAKIAIGVFLHYSEGEDLASERHVKTWAKLHGKSAGFSGFSWAGEEILEDEGEGIRQDWPWLRPGHK